MMSQNKVRKEWREAASSSESCCYNPQKASAMMAGCCEGAGRKCESMLQAMMRMCTGQEAHNETEKSAEDVAQGA